MYDKQHVRDFLARLHYNKKPSPKITNDTLAKQVQEEVQRLRSLNKKKKPRTVVVRSTRTSQLRAEAIRRKYFL